MRTMLPLRCTAVASNVAFLSYGIWLHLWPVAGLHALLLPLNVGRLWQIRRLQADIRAARSDEVVARVLTSDLRPQRHCQGTVLFRKGEPADCAYYLHDGEIAFPEIGAQIGPGQLFGEIGVLSRAGVRTASAVCRTDVVVYRIDEEALARMFYQSPSFAFGLMRLVTSRLLERLPPRQGAGGAGTGP